MGKEYKMIASLFFFTIIFSVDPDQELRIFKLLFNRFKQSYRKNMVVLRPKSCFGKACSIEQKPPTKLQNPPKS